MAKNLALCIFAATTSFVFADKRNLTEPDKDFIEISLLAENKTSLSISDKDKEFLRLGVHQTADCQDFEKAFICIRKCLDLNYHIAHANKACSCTCYKNRILAQYKLSLDDTAATNWKLGAPTTKRPQWAGGVFEPKPKDYEVNGDYTFTPEPHETEEAEDVSNDYETTLDDTTEDDTTVDDTTVDDTAGDDTTVGDTTLDDTTATNDDTTTDA